MNLALSARALLAATLMTAVLAPQAEASKKAARPFTVVLDPGHGGEDTGATYRIGREELAEKDLTLLLGEEAAAQLRSRRIHTVLTRTEDRNIPLPERTALANRIRADVFISLHMNSSGKSGIRAPGGIETFILNNSTDESSRRLADLENSVLEGSVTGGHDHSTPVSLILKDHLLDANLAESRRLACLVQDRLVKTASPRRNRGVKQALFYVLLGTDMPSALVEAGFLDNARDRNLVLSQAGRSLMGRALADALAGFARPGNRERDLGTCQVR